MAGMPPIHLMRNLGEGRWEQPQFQGATTTTTTIMTITMIETMTTIETMTEAAVAKAMIRAVAFTATAPFQGPGTTRFISDTVMTRR